MKGFNTLPQLFTPQRHQKHTAAAQDSKMGNRTYKTAKKQDIAVAIKPAVTTCCKLCAKNYSHLNQEQIDTAGWEEPTEIVIWRSNAPTFHIRKAVTSHGSRWKFRQSCSWTEGQGD